MVAVDEEKIEPVGDSLGPSTDRISSTGPEHQDDDTDSEASDHEEAARRPDDEKSHMSDEAEAHEDPEGGPEGLNVNVPPTQVQSRAHSYASSTRSRPLSIVPRSKRRGLFGQFAIIPEVDRPYDYSNKTKWTLTTVVALAAAGAPIGSAIFYRTQSPASLVWSSKS